MNDLVAVSKILS